jgi:hypothetical protein
MLTACGLRQKKPGFSEEQLYRPWRDVHGRLALCILGLGRGQ